MSLQFIIGSAGSGKSTYLFEQVIAQAMQESDKNFLVVVPEQFTMHTQQQLVKMHPSHAIMNIDVLSFDRMAYRVFDELGTDTLEVLEETGKHLLLRKVAQEKKDALSYLKKNIKKPGYIAQMKSLFSELMQYDISPDDFADMLQLPSMSSAFRGKGEDILLLYRGYQEALEGKYITAEEILQKLMEVAEQSQILRDAVVVFDGFTGFTPIQNQFLQLLMTIAEKMIFTVTCDQADRIFEEPAEEELFAMSKKMVVRLARMAEEVHVAIEESVVLGNEQVGRFVPGGQLIHLERNLFRPKAKAYTLENTSEDFIEVCSLSNPRQELTYVACQIEKQVREHHMRYKDFAVVCADLDAYAHLVPGIFEKLHIPYFLDAKTGVVFHPFIECMQSLFAVVENNFLYESVLRLLRTGMTNLSWEETDILENYILAARVRGATKYRQGFVILPMGYQAKDLVRLNEIRQKLWDGLGAFYDRFPAKRGTACEISTALYEWIVQYDMQTKLLDKANEYMAEGDEVRAKEYEQIYGVVMGLLDKIVSVLGEEEMSLSAYGELLDTGFESLRIGVIPPQNDSVVIGNIERTRMADIKVLYLVGACDGAIPKTAGNGGILSQLERQQLKDAKYELAPTDREKAFMQRFYLYFVMTKPSHGLVVTYAQVGNDGKATKKSYLIDTLTKLFPSVKVNFMEELPEEERFYTREMTRGYLTEKMREYVDEGAASEWFKALLAWEKEEKDSHMEEVLAAAFYVHKKEALSKAATEAVFGNQIRESVSRMEQYARCAYAYFLNYGLGLRQREEHEFEKVDMGNLYHSALEYYAKSMQEQDDFNWYTVSEEQMSELVEEAIAHAYQTMTKTQVMDDARETYMLRRMGKTFRQTVWALTEQVRKGSFVPSAFEVDFREVGDLKTLQFQLDEMHTMQLSGKIDRMDLCVNPDCVYVKIVDYKSGAKDLDFNQLYHGLQVQLVLYLGAAMEGLKRQYPERDIKPGALFYYHIHQPLVKAEDAAKSSADAAILDALRVNGVLNKDEVVVEALHHGLQGKSDVIPAKRNANGEFDANSKVLAEEEFALMQSYVSMLMQECGEKIVSGEIDCEPYRMGDKNGCTYCEYHSICGFDTTIEGYAYRSCQTEKERQQIFEKMKETLEEYNQGKGGE